MLRKLTSGFQAEKPSFVIDLIKSSKGLNIFASVKNELGHIEELIQSHDLFQHFPEKLRFTDKYSNIIDSEFSEDYCKILGQIYKETQLEVSRRANDEYESNKLKNESLKRQYYDLDQRFVLVNQELNNEFGNTQYSVDRSMRTCRHWATKVDHQERDINGMWEIKG